MTAAAGADLFPWGADEMVGWLTTCPAAAFRVTAMRFEQLRPGHWWADLLGYRTDVRRPFTWPGFRLTMGTPMGVELPPYLATAPAAQSESLVTLVRTVAEHGLAEAQTAAAPSFTVSVPAPRRPRPRPGGR